MTDDDDKPDSFDAWVKSVNDRLALQDEFLMKTLQQVERVRDLNQALMDLITVREFHEWRRVADFRPELATVSSAERDRKAAEVTVDHIASRCPDSVKAELAEDRARAIEKLVAYASGNVAREDDRNWN